MLRQKRSSCELQSPAAGRGHHRVPGLLAVPLRLAGHPPVTGAYRLLGATPWIRRAEAELRACGVTAQATATAPGALADLTPQQRQIVILASRGLTDGDIADRLFLSPRTVAYHLYNSYPSSASPAATSSATSSTRPPTRQPPRRPADRPQTRTNPRPQ